MATLMLICELILFIIRSKYNLIYYTIGIIGLKSIDYFSVAFDVFYIFKKYTYFMYVAYDRFNPVFGLQYANKSREDRGVISTFSWGGPNFLKYFSMPPDYWIIGKKTALYM